MGSSRLLRAWWRMNGLVLRAASLPALIALVAFGLLGVLADRQNRQIFEQHARAAVADRLSVIRARLEGNISRDIQIGHGVVAAIATRPSLDTAEFGAFVEHLMETGSDLRLVVAAPDMVVRMAHPLPGNEKVIGLDYMQTPSQREAVLRARETGRLVLAGPLDLVQGGVGLVGRIPVFLDRPHGPPAFWGIVSVVIDVDRLYANSGISAADFDLDLTIRGRDGKGAAGDIFFGSEAALDQNPLIATIAIPGGTWQLAATPKGGWPPPPNAALFRLMLAVIGALIVVPILVTGHLYAERRQNLDELGRAKSLADARNRQLEEANRRIRHASLHDALTGLPNRRHLMDHLGRLDSDMAATAGGIAMLHIDLDRFKQVNDAFGHATGDRLLQHVAGLMRATFRPADLVARIGGDEFVAVCLGDEPEPLARRLAGDLLSAFRQPIDLGETRCRSGLSIGIACADAGNGPPSRLLIDADIALYRAKECGRNRFEFFTEALEAEVVSAKHLADQILTGIDEGQFTAHYQQQFHATTREVVGLEALVRWKHPAEGLLAPADFLEVAEDVDALPTLDHIVLETALADRLRWRAAGLAVPRIAVNVSMGRLRDERLVDRLKALAIEPGALSFELTEAIYLDDSDEVVTDNIRRLRDLGIEIEIDDFGTGYASIVSLMRLKPSRLKIARQLTAAVTTSFPQRQLVRSIVEIGRTQDIGIVAEGVETLEQADILADLGCDILQGFAFGRPMAAGALARIMAEEAVSPSADIRRRGRDSSAFSARL
ncbi:putative bifunctional diguanylate cyclase/phosphodiesterase [Pleomorphomonas koreensis]|uniref:putative bifunctional diguanylate cyclase/phosphodiesterase n=1 Tax=Pleomorphomonas koreensis TaxID=257440 RepID=UPI0003FC17C5|nr:EAL domain-containing protein [Pleomorphomonas koreensis]